MSSGKRAYALKERARSQQETRRRIVAATAELHEEVGPARTTITEIARRAGVQRLTVYKHFPDDAQLFEACSGHFLAAHPRPDLGEPLALEDPAERVRAVLGALYPWYRETEQMAANIQRDRLLIPSIEERAAITIDEPMGALAEALAGGFPSRGRRAFAVRALISVALDFWTWRRLKLQGLSDKAAAELMAVAIACASD